MIYILARYINQQIVASDTDYRAIMSMDQSVMDSIDNNGNDIQSQHKNTSVDSSTDNDSDNDSDSDSDSDSDNPHTFPNSNNNSNNNNNNVNKRSSFLSQRVKLAKKLKNTPQGQVDSADLHSVDTSDSDETSPHVVEMGDPSEQSIDFNAKWRNRFYGIGDIGDKIDKLLDRADVKKNKAISFMLKMFKITAINKALDAYYAVSRNGCTWRISAMYHSVYKKFLGSVDNINWGHNEFSTNKTNDLAVAMTGFYKALVKNMLYLASICVVDRTKKIVDMKMRESCPATIDELKYDKGVAEKCHTYIKVISRYFDLIMTYSLELGMDMKEYNDTTYDYVYRSFNGFSYISYWDLEIEDEKKKEACEKAYENAYLIHELKGEMKKTIPQLSAEYLNDIGTTEHGYVDCLAYFPILCKENYESKIQPLDIAGDITINNLAEHLICMLASVPEVSHVLSGLPLKYTRYKEVRDSFIVDDRHDDLAVMWENHTRHDVQISYLNIINGITPDKTYKEVMLIYSSCCDKWFSIILGDFSVAVYKLIILYRGHEDINIENIKARKLYLGIYHLSDIYHADNIIDALTFQSRYICKFPPE